MKNSTYSEEFYKNRHEQNVENTRIIIDILMKHIPAPHSVLDVGCGVGTWLWNFQQIGVEKVYGIDSSCVPVEYLVIDKSRFETFDLDAGYTLNHLLYNADLVISVEVAEHISEKNALNFVRLLTRCSQFVLFSAAVPYQGGENHVNEQWQSYWANLFAKCDYEVYDIIRPEIWNDRRIPFWLRQNLLLYVDNNYGFDCEPAKILDVIHPEQYLNKKLRGF